MVRALFIALVVTSSVFSDDSEIVQGTFRSENNSIEEIHLEISSSKNMAVLKLKNKLTGKNARSRNVSDNRSNYGDSTASYAYLEIPKEDPFKVSLIRYAYENQSNVDLMYSCGEQPDDRKRRLFQFYVETNCEIQAITLKKQKEKRGYGW